MDIEERMAMLEFHNELLFENSDLSRYIYETKITREQYQAIMDLMDSYRNRIESGAEVNNSEFEQDIYALVPERRGDYHFCEIISHLFAENGQWEEVFPALYGHMPKYGGTL